MIKRFCFRITLFSAIALQTIIAHAQFTAVMGYAGTWDEPSCYDSTFFHRYSNVITHLIQFKVGPHRNPPYMTWEMGPTKHDQMATLFVSGGHSAGMRVLLCIGGVGTEAQEYAYIIQDSARCQNQVDVFAAYAQARNYDGLDLDWETDINREGFMMLSRMLRRKLDNWVVNGVPTRGILSYAIGREWNTAQDVETLNSLYDHLWIMTYDGNMGGSWVSGFHEEIYNTASEYPLLATEYNNSVDVCSGRWASHGLNKAKTSLIFGAYGYAWQSGCGHPVLVPGHPNNPNTHNCNQWRAHLAYPWELWRIQNFMATNPTGTVYHDTLAMMAWWSGPSDPSAPQSWGYGTNGFSYINYNDEWAIEKKFDYTASKNWGGIALCGIGNGYTGQSGTPAQRWPLIEIIKNKLQPPQPSAPAFAIQPQNTVVRAGQLASFLATANGYPIPTMQWQNSVNGGASWTNISGATSSSYQTPATTLADSGKKLRCIASNSQGTTFSSVATILVSSVTSANPMSDDFSAPSLNARWVASKPSLIGVTGYGTGDALLSLTLDGTRRDMWEDNKEAPRIMQNVANGDFEVVTKFQSVPTQAYSGEGILFEQSTTQFLRFDILYQPDGLKFYSGYINGGTSTQFLNQPITIPNPLVWVKVKRTADSWSASYSVDGTTFNSFPAFTQSMIVDSMGVFACNSILSGPTPSFVTRVDYFFNASSPISPEDPVSGSAVGTFAASKDTLPVGGGDVTLTWASSNAQSATIDQGIGSVPISGSTTVTIGQTKTFTLTLTNAIGSNQYLIRLVVPLPGGDGNLYDLTALGSPIALITNPTGSGNRNLEIIRDGITPPQGSSNSNDQYDTYNGGGTRLVDWIGYTYSPIQSFGSIILQEGIHASEGGFFASTPRVEVRVGAQWIEVQGLVITPAYGAGSASNFAMYTLSFNAISGDGIRVAGTPGGTAQYLSVAELRVMGTATSTVVPDNKPKDFDLLRNYPNPFNPSTTIEFAVATNSHVTFAIYNILGQKVRTLIDQVMDQGKWPITWDGRDDNNRLSSSGVYLYKMQVGDFVATRKMILSK